MLLHQKPGALNSVFVLLQFRRPEVQQNEGHVLAGLCVPRRVWGRICVRGSSGFVKPTVPGCRPLLLPSPCPLSSP